MKTKKYIFSISIFVFLVTTGNSKTLKFTKEELGSIAKWAAVITSRQHYRQTKLDDKVSSTLFDEYFKTLDPNKIYFTKQDIKKFERFRYLLDDQLNYEQLDFAFRVYDLFLKKVELYKQYAEKVLAKGFDFTKDESYTYDREDVPWAPNNKELKNIWRKKIKNDVLTLILMEKAKKEKEEKGKKEEKPEEKGKKKREEKTKIHSSWHKKKPEERIISRITHYLSYLKQNKDIDILELYLSTLDKIYDPHSAYMSPKTEEDFNISMKLSLVGIGALLTTDDGYTKIVKLIPGGPAEKDGRLKSEDRIIAVAQDGSAPVNIVDMPLSQVVRMIRGKKDTKVHLTILEGSKGVNAIPEIITLTRDKVELKESEAKGEIKEVESINGKKLKIGVMTIPSFYIDFKAAFADKKDYKSSTRDVKKILNKFRKENIDGLVIDIRSNGGGSLREAIELTGIFIEKGPVVQVKTHNGQVVKKNDPDDTIYYEGPLLVLTNLFSASASEIFAGAIKDHKRGIIVGDKHTHGKGTVQTIVNLGPFLNISGYNVPAGSVKLTTAKFYRINGSSTQQKGVTPDIIFPSYTDSMKVGEKYLDYPLPWDAIDKEKYSDYDPQLIELLPKLKQLSQKRRKNNNKFKLLLKKIKTYDKFKNRKSITLNEKKRWDEYLKEKEILEEQNKLMKLFDRTTDDLDTTDDELDKKNDLYLEESLNIIRDFIDLKNKNYTKNQLQKSE